VNSTALVVPSIRKDSFERFISEWQPTGLFEQVDLILMEDNPQPTFEVDESVRMAAHLSWKDIDRQPWSWIIPRRSDTVRSYAYWWAAPQYKYIMTLDDDCYPRRNSRGVVPSNIVSDHRMMLTNRTRWYNTLNNVIPRGMPYFNRGTRDVYVNHGLWQGVLDYDAPHQLVQPLPEIFDESNRIVPHGAYFPMCGMNVMWKSEVTVLMYHLLMGQRVLEVTLDSNNVLERLPFDRFGDIWCGILMKKVIDHLGWAVSTGTPYIHHDRASNPFTNLRKEANGIEVNEWFWEKVDAIKLECQTPAYCYEELGIAVGMFGGEHSDYWSRLGSAMVTWAQLFK
jgi:reversibly glycosylated polypeptide/UDP-arabinopyranose mutase